MLTLDEAVDAAHVLYKKHNDEVAHFDRMHDYVRGLRGVPDVPDAANDEVKEIARLSVLNVIAPVIDTFSQNLCVVGYRSSQATENAAGWDAWQANRMDARQAEVHRAVLTYGLSYVSMKKEGDRVTFHPRSPRRLHAAYVDPLADKWPALALESWLDHSGAKPRRMARLLDATHEYLIDFGESSQQRFIRRLGVAESVTAQPHGFAFCPVVRYLNRRDSEEEVRGEVEPLIRDQLAINGVNFDRLIVSRFGAFPQKVIIGWDAGAGEVLRAAASRVWNLPETDIKVDSFPATNLAPYSDLLSEMKHDVAVRASVSPLRLMSKVDNVATDTLAQMNAPEQLRSGELRTSIGESHEQLLSAASGVEDDGAEAVWKDTEPRSFGAVVDGIVKLVSAGFPMDVLLSSIPGLSQQQITSARQQLAGQGALAEALRALAAPPQAIEQ